MNCGIEVTTVDAASEVSAFYRTFPLPLFVPVNWDGPQYLDDMDGADGRAHALTVVCASAVGGVRWLRVGTSLNDGTPWRQSRRWWELQRDLGMASRSVACAPTPQEAVATVEDLPERAASLNVDQQAVSFVVVHAGPYWAGHAQVATRHVWLLVARLATDEVSLRAREDIEDLI